MVKTITVTPLRPSTKTSPATNTLKKGRRRCLELKSPELVLEDVTSERQSIDCKPKAAATHLNNVIAVEKQRRRKHIQTKKAVEEELECVTDLKLYAAYLSLESGVFLDHPWMKKLIDVSNRRLDPHEVLKMYREDPGSLKVTDLKDPNRFWMPPKAEGMAPLQAMNRCAAMRALVGKQNWKESPKLQSKLEKFAHDEMPPDYPRAQDDLDGFFGYIAEIEKDLTAFLEGNSKDVSHQGSADAMEA